MSTTHLHIKDATVRKRCGVIRSWGEVSPLETEHSQLRYPECNSTFHHWIFTKTRILRHEGKARLIFMHVGHFAVQCHELGFHPRDLKHFLHLGVEKHQLFLKGTENTLLHTAISRSWLWVWIHSQGVCFLFTVPRALHLHELCHRNRSTAA